MLDTVSGKTVNDIDLAALGEVVEGIQADASKAKVGFHVTTRWQGQTRSETTVEAITLAGERVERDFRITVDEPTELLGTNAAANPQELLMTAINACMMVGYVAGASIRGIELESVEIETKGELDLRGFLGLDDQVPAGYRELDYDVRIKGKGTPEQFAEIHQSVLATSPNYFNISRPVKMNGNLVLG
ncbi:OsmC family protein [Sphingomonas sp. ID1715]|uniref:OsmC family protein n=1 Tax=Sphingomonas sp. ID1715 TaxID=1656898 RepID=UPI001488203F|nr:OsmC family protein [Sphingomonas sp. ID1715]NNM75871.1 OsmC family protein [Sphingomonas sp. ID1715]